MSRLTKGDRVRGSSGGIDEVVKDLGGEDYIVRRANGKLIARRGHTLPGWVEKDPNTPQPEEGGGGGGRR